MTSESGALQPGVASRRPSNRPGPLLRSLPAAQGGVYVATGLWPIVSMRTFEAVTGPKHDHWLVKTVGVLAAAIGSVLLSAARRPDRQTALLGTASAAAFATVDVVYVARGRISRVYLLDALLEVAFVAAWAAALTGRAAGRATDARPPGDRPWIAACAGRHSFPPPREGEHRPAHPRRPEGKRRHDRTEGSLHDPAAGSA